MGQRAEKRIGNQHGVIGYANTSKTKELKMANNLTANAQQPKTRLELLTKVLTPQELQSHVDLVGVRLELISRKYDRFGWDNISAEVRSMLKADWNDKLMDYSIDEIDAAISQYVDDTKNKKAAHEGQIKAIIIANRQRVVASQPKAPDTYVPCENPITPEAHAKLMEEFGSPRGKVKSFNSKPEEKE